MKKLTHCLLLLFFGLTLQAQTFNYQTTVRNSIGNPQANTMKQQAFCIVKLKIAQQINMGGYLSPLDKAHP